MTSQFAVTATATNPPLETPMASLAPTSTATAVQTATATPQRPQLNDDGTFYWALIGDSVSYLEAEREAGIEAKVFSLSWRLYETDNGLWNQTYINRKMAEYRQIRETGLDVILSIGYHDPPEWIHTTYEASRYVNQYGDPYVSLDEIDGGDLNIVWNPALREIVERYVLHVFNTFGSDFAAVRMGGGRFGELSYPPAKYQGQDNSYWAFDDNALASNPVPNWRPGDPAAGDEPALFLEWYLDGLVEFQNWQIQMLQTSFAGPLMILYPSWGLRPGDVELALSTGLDGSSPPELNGEVQRGYDFTRQVAALSEPNLVLTTTWLDADVYPDREYGDDPRFWSPARFLAHLAARSPLRPALFGENTGQGSEADMALSIQRMVENELLGMAWYRESELISPEYASLDVYREMIQKTDTGASPSG